MAQSSKKAVVAALLGNAVITVLKFIAALLTHSASMMNEAVHSLMDTVNQLFLLLGLRYGERPPDNRYAFGHGQKKYLWNLWSAIGLFSIGAGLGLAHAWSSYTDVHSFKPLTDMHAFGYDFSPYWISGAVLAFALVVDGYVLSVATREVYTRMRAAGADGWLRYLARSDDPTLTAVVLEDVVAVLGVLLAAAGIGLTVLTGNPLWDIGVSVLIALMLGAIAFFLGAVNMRYLTDIRDPGAEQAFLDVANGLHEVERFHDLRSIVVDEANTVVVAEVELREEVVLSGLTDKIDSRRRGLRADLSAERRDDPRLQQYIDNRAVVEATLERTEELVDRIEAEVRKICPRIAHVTIEVEGIAAAPDGASPEKPT